MRSSGPIVSLQMAYSLWERDAENGNLAACREFGMGFMAYSVLGRGYLAGLFHAPDDLPADDGRRRSDRFQGDELDRSRQLLAAIEDIAREKHATPAQVSIAWVLAQGDGVIPIPGAKSRRHLDDDLGALEIELTAADLARLDALRPADPAAGPRELVTSGRA